MMTNQAKCPERCTLAGRLWAVTSGRMLIAVMADDPHEATMKALWFYSARRPGDINRADLGRVIVCATDGTTRCYRIDTDTAMDLFSSFPHTANYERIETEGT